MKVISGLLVLTAAVNCQASLRKLPHNGVVGIGATNVHVLNPEFLSEFVGVATSSHSQAATSSQVATSSHSQAATSSQVATSSHSQAATSSHSQAATSSHSQAATSSQVATSSHSQASTSSATKTPTQSPSQASATSTQTPTHAVAATKQQYGINYNGGPVMGTLGAVVNLYLIWYTPSGSGFTTASKNVIRNFVSNLGGSAWWGVEGSYMDAGGHFINVGTGSVVVKGETTITGGSTSITNALGVVAGTVGTNFPADTNGIYLLLTDSTVSESSSSTNSFCRQYCGYHTAFYYTNAPGVFYKYSFIGNAATLCPSGCGGGLGPNGADGSDGMVSVIAHELAETVSDPVLNAWYDGSGQENGDKCAWNFGPTSTAPNGAPYNMVLNSILYKVQQLWANRPVAGSCSMGP